MLVVIAPSYNYTHNIPFSLRCNVWAEFDGHPLYTTIKWIRISQSNVTSQIMEETLDSYKCIPQIQTYLFVNRNNSGCEHALGSGSDFSSSSPSVLGYQSVLNTTENGTDTVVTYRCQATTMNINIHSDITVYVESKGKNVTINFAYNLVLNIPQIQQKCLVPQLLALVYFPWQ